MSLPWLTVWFYHRVALDPKTTTAQVLLPVDPSPSLLPHLKLATDGETLRYVRVVHLFVTASSSAHPINSRPSDSIQQLAQNRSHQRPLPTVPETKKKDLRSRLVHSIHLALSQPGKCAPLLALVTNKRSTSQQHQQQRGAPDLLSPTSDTTTFSPFRAATPSGSYSPSPYKSTCPPRPS